MLTKLKYRNKMYTPLAVGGIAMLSLLSSCGGGGGSSTLSTAELLNMSASEVVQGVKARQFTCRQYVETLIARANQYASLNPLITLDKTGALAAADAADVKIAQGNVSQELLCLPIVVKDNINTNNLPTTAGTKALQNARPNANAPSLQKLINAGAIVLAKANMHELAFGITSTNKTDFAGIVKNPYDTTRIPGGSSGGTAVSLATRIAPAGLGTDTGGSTRVPAALTGTVGFRPSVGNGGAERRYNDANQVVPISHTRDTIGPMARTVKDLQLLDAIISGDSTKPTLAIKGMRIGLPSKAWENLDASLAEVMKKVKDALVAQGAILVDIDSTLLWQTNDKVSFQVALHEPIADITNYLQASGITGVTLESINEKIASPDVKGAFSAILGDVFGGQYADAMNIHRPAMQKIYQDYFKQVDVLLFPTTPLPAALINEAKGSDKIMFNGQEVDTFGTYIRNTDPASNAGIPGLSLYAGMTSTNLPVGVEIDGPLGSDRKLLQLGVLLESLFGNAPAPK